MNWIAALAWCGALLAAALAFFGGYFWIDVARRQHSWPQDARYAAKFTGAALVLGAVSFVMIVASNL